MVTNQKKISSKATGCLFIVCVLVWVCLIRTSSQSPSHLDAPLITGNGLLIVSGRPRLACFTSGQLNQALLQSQLQSKCTHGTHKFHSKCKKFGVNFTSPELKLHAVQVHFSLKMHTCVSLKVYKIDPKRMHLPGGNLQCTQIAL